MYDTIIVGAGSAGCALAARLSEDPARKVLVLEAGRPAPETTQMPALWINHVDSEIDWVYRTEPQQGCKMRRMAWPRGKAVGGSGAINAMIYIRGLPSDYDGWAAMGCPGWSWAEVLPLFKRSENNERFGNSDLHGSGGPLNIADVPFVDPTERLWLDAAAKAGLAFNEDFNGASQEGSGFYQLYCKAGERFGTAKAYLLPAMDRPNLTVKTGVLTLRVVIDRGRAVGVEFLENGRPEIAHTSGEVVLSSGAIGSTQLLLLSGIGPAAEIEAAGVKPLHDLPGVGKNLQDHINIPITFHTKESRGIGGMSAGEIEGAIEEWRERRSGPITSNWAAVGGHARSRPEMAEPDLQLYCVVAANRDHARYMSAKPGLTLHSTLQRPNSRGEIRLRSADPIEHPVIDPKYFISDESGADLATLVRGVQLNRRIAAQSPLAEVIEQEITPSLEAVSEAEIEELVRGHCTTLYHPCGTCRMGSDALAVVGPDLKVQGLENLRVADASIFPKVISGNTQTPTVMVAERCAAAMR